MLARLADRLILEPTTDRIETEGKSRRLVSVDGQQIEVWVQRIRAGSDSAQRPPDVFILKFPGTAGRAERATEHPAEVWDDDRAEIWTVNPLGYGGSSGSASLRSLAPCAQGVYREMAKLADGRLTVVTGNSLGTLSALYLAAHFDVDGLLLRNPPPLRQLIVGRHGWWTLGVGAYLLARQIPESLCALRNARACRAPALFVMSGRDRLVPPRYQRRIVGAYAGPHRVLLLPRADHADPMDETEKQRYAELLRWLRDSATQGRSVS